MTTMMSSRPYLIRAMHEWISDNGLTPYILVDASADGAVVPEQFIENGKIVLNISERAAEELHQDNDWILFSARFNGHAMDISVPVSAVLAIYAKENGQGMVLDKDNNVAASAPDLTQSKPKELKTELSQVKPKSKPQGVAPVKSAKVSKKPKKPGKPHLEIVK